MGWEKMEKMKNVLLSNWMMKERKGGIGIEKGDEGTVRKVIL